MARCPAGLGEGQKGRLKFGQGPADRISGVLARQDPENTVTSPPFRRRPYKAKLWRTLRASGDGVMEANSGALTVSGQVKWFDAHKGYGFITPTSPLREGGDILLHQTCVRQSGFRQAVEGAMVVCEA